MNWFNHSPYQASTYFLKLNNDEFRIRYAFKHGRKQNDLFIVENRTGWFIIPTRSISFTKVNELVKLRKYLEGKLRRGEINVSNMLQTSIWRSPNIPTAKHTPKVAYIEEGVFLVAEPGDLYQSKDYCKK